MTGYVTKELAQQFAQIRCTGGFDVILADCPHLYENWSEAGEDKNPNQHYDCMTVEQLCELPVELLAADNCAMFWWGVWPLMPWWNQIIEAWGFKFAGLAWEWIKFNPETGKYAFGPGYGTRKNLGPCLLCTRGSPRLRDRIDGSFFGQQEIPAGVRSVRDFIEVMPLDAIRSPRREHSRKPDQQYDRIETMFDGRKIELFARQRRPGWTSWGREVGKFQEASIERETARPDVPAGSERQPNAGADAGGARWPGAGGIDPITGAQRLQPQRQRSLAQVHQPEPSTWISLGEAADRVVRGMK